jgi:hypothetical protein
MIGRDTIIHHLSDAMGTISGDPVADQGLKKYSG